MRGRFSPHVLRTTILARCVPVEQSYSWTPLIPGIGPPMTNLVFFVTSVLVCLLSVNVLVWFLIWFRYSDIRGRTPTIRRRSILVKVSKSHGDDLSWSSSVSPPPCKLHRFTCSICSLAFVASSPSYRPRRPSVLTSETRSRRPARSSERCTPPSFHSHLGLRITMNIVRKSVLAKQPR
jgi:hypothetical protein